MTIVTPVNAEEELRALLHKPATKSIAERLPPTHFARFVIIKADGPKLLFSSKFDGPRCHYLRELAETEQAHEIWSHCELGGVPLDQYLLDRRNHVKSQYVVDAFRQRPRVEGFRRQPTVAAINAALSLRKDLGEFAGRSEALDPIALAHEFRQLPSVRRLLARV